MGQQVKVYRELQFLGAGTGVLEVHMPTNLADALSIKDSAGDLIVFNTTTGTQRITLTPATTVTGVLTSNGGITMGDAKNIVVDTTTGTKIGTATTQKLGFYNATPIVKPTAFTQTYATAEKTLASLTASAVGTTGSTSTSPYGYTTAAQADSIFTQLNNLIADHADLAQVVNSIIDDLQSLGLVA